MSRSQTANLTNGVINISGTYTIQGNYYPSSAPSRYYPKGATLRITAGCSTKWDESQQAARANQVGSQSGEPSQGTIYKYCIQYGPDANGGWKTFIRNSWDGGGADVRDSNVFAWDSSTSGRLNLAGKSGTESITYDGNTRTANYLDITTDRIGKQLYAGIGNNNDNYRLRLKAVIIYTEYEVSVSASEGGTASISSSPATISSNSTWVRDHENVTVTANASTGYSFEGWYEGETLKSSNASYTFTCGTSDHSLQARFLPNHTLSLLASPVEGGTTIDYGGGSYAAGQTVMITVATNSGYIFDGWYKNGIKIYQKGTYIFTMPNEDVTLEARWVEDIFSSEYEHIGYIESTGTQYINTDVNLVTAGTTDCEIHVDVERTTDRISDNTLFGLSNDNSDTYNCRVFANYGSGISMWNNSSDPRTVSFTDIYPNDEIKHLTFNQTSTTLSLTDGVETVNQTVTAATTSKLYLLSSHSAERSCGNFKLYSAKIKVNNVLVRDFIPARRKIDSVLGLYDLVENKFYINDGSGEDFKTGIYKIGEKRDFSYITGGTISSHEAQEGSVQSFRVDKTGLYKLEVTGGKGGLSSQKTGYSGDGGYSLGYKVLKSGELIYVGCGGGLNRVFNGGGLANTTTYAGNGGGATHVAKVTGTLETIGASNLNDILIIAGGGGGQGEANSNNTNLKYGGVGGGLTGADATGGTYNGAGGTQSEGGSTVKDNVVVSQGTFGKGGDGQTGYGSNFQAGGGGAGLYGGSGGGWGTGTTNGAGGGGSGYIGGVPEIIYKGTTYTPETIQGGVTGGFDYINYDRLDWIESTGTQYINTGYAKEGRGDSARLIADIEFTDTSSSTQIIFGSVATSTSYYYYNQYIGATSNNKWILQWRNDDSSSRINGSWLLDTKYKVDGFLNRYSGRFLKAWDPNNTQVASIGFSGSDSDYPAYTFYLFAGNMNGTATNFCKMKCYSAQCYKGGTLVRNYVPAKRKSDSAIGLLDTLNNVFYGNAGTGAFNAGPSESVYGHGHATLTLLDMSSSTRKHIIAG